MAPKGRTCLSNMPTESEKDQAGGTLTTFEQTHKMSTFVSTVETSSTDGAPFDLLTLLFPDFCPCHRVLLCCTTGTGKPVRSHYGTGNGTVQDKNFQI